MPRADEPRGLPTLPMTDEPPVAATLRIAVVGGGWAGLSAAIEATRRGHRVTLFEMAGQLGGRARRVEVDGTVLDNGQHILIGAYTATLELMRLLGIAVDDVLLRTPLRLIGPDGSGLHCKAARRRSRSCEPSLDTGHGVGATNSRCFESPQVGHGLDSSATHHFPCRSCARV